MRKGGLVCLFLCWLCSLWAVTAQTLAERERVELKRRQVPKEVRRNVRLAYPYHIYKDWAKVDTLYSVRVISVNYETVYFDATGEWLRAYRPVRPSELPYKTYLFLKEEFGGYRVLRAYQVQQSDDLAHYSVEMEHKRIHSLKTYLEFNFVGDLTVLDGKAVGIVQDKTAGEAALSQQTWASLYADAYDPVAEEAAYAAEAKAAAEAMVATVDTTVVQLAVMPADTIVCVDTVTLTTDSLPLVHTDTVMLVDTVDAVDTVTLEPDTVLTVVSDTLVAEVDTAAIQPASVSANTIFPADTIVPVADTIVPVADTLPLVHTDTVTLADTVVAVDTVAVPLADTVVSADAVVSVTPVADTLPALAEAIVPVSDTVAVVSTDTVGPETPLYPEIVGKNFKKRFPNAEKVNWRQADGLYLVTFDQFGQVMSAAFREDGIQVYTAYAFSRKEMPLPIERYLQASAAKMKMTEGWRVVYESKYKRMFPSADRPKDYYYVVMGRKIPKRKEWQYIRYTFNQNAQFESKSDYVQPFEK